VRLLPANPPPGPTEESFWQSPIRGPWMTSILGSLLLPFVVLVGFTGFMSHAAYNPDLGMNQVVPRDGDLDLLLFDWPTGPTWLYALNQGLHTIVGIMVVPLILAKLWSVFPKLFAWPPVKSPAHALERVSLLLLVGGAGFMWATGLLNSQNYYPWNFNFVVAHYYGAWAFLGALFVHVATKFTTLRTAYAERGVLKPLMDDVAHTEAEPYRKGGLAPEVPEAPTISRRGLLGLVGATSAGLFVVTAGQSIGGPLRSVALLAPRGRGAGGGAQGFPVNKTARLAGITPAKVGPGYRLTLTGGSGQALTREQLTAMPQHTEELPIACVEGWSSTQTWTGVRLKDLAAMAGLGAGQGLQVISLQEKGAFRQTTLSHDQVMNEKSLLALQVGGEALSMDHGFPARIIVPAQPGVHNTKWVTELKVVDV
jgi:DMSO/TMAO reductase YedYZ molybdopterin-dependent catalytic subunit